MAINGAYKVIIKRPMGKQEAILKLAAEGNRLQGSITIKGNTIEIIATVNPSAFPSTSTSFSVFPNLSFKFTK